MGRVWGSLEEAEVKFRWVSCAVQASVPRRLVARIHCAGGGGGSQARCQEDKQPAGAGYLGQRQ